MISTLDLDEVRDEAKVIARKHDGPMSGHAFVSIVAKASAVVSRRLHWRSLCK